VVRFQPSENLRHHRPDEANIIFLVLGAGISVSAGIPDFRSESGLFQTLKRDNPKEALTSGRDLFDASVFNVSKICSRPFGLDFFAFRANIYTAFASTTTRALPHGVFAQ
jgi:hypothetical protein